MTVVRASAVREVELVGKIMLSVVLRTDVLLLVRTIRTGPLPRIVYPADKVIVIGFLADACQIGGKGPALHIVAFPNGVAGQTAASLKKLFAMRSVSGYRVRH